MFASAGDQSGEPWAPQPLPENTCFSMMIEARSEAELIREAFQRVLADGEAVVLRALEGRTFSSAEALRGAWDVMLHRLIGTDGQPILMASAVDVTDTVLLAETDGLTGLANRRRLNRSIHGMQIGDGLVLIDLDHFKRVNDTFGHCHGDQVLRDFAGTLRSVVRKQDLVARYGGEEFCMLLPFSGRSGARSLLRRLRQRWKASHPSLTFSAGVAVHVRGAEPSETIERADAALYRAKANGRDQIVMASASSVQKGARGRTRKAPPLPPSDSSPIP